MLFKKRPYVHSFIKTNSIHMRFSNDQEQSTIIQTQAVFYVFEAKQPGRMFKRLITTINPAITNNSNCAALQRIEIQLKQR